MRILGRRVVFYLLTALAAITVVFFIPRMMPGNTVEAILAHLQGQISASTVKSLAVQFGVQTKEGLLGQYLNYLNNILHGNFGISTSYYPSSVSSVIKGALPWTLGLVGVATIISFGLGTLVGVLVAWRRGSWLDNLLPAMTFFQAAPYFFIAFLALELFAARLGWFPTGRAYNQLDFPAFTLPFAGDVLSHAVLPALTIVVCSAVLPSVAGVSLAIGFIVSGALLTEIVFSYPGVGWILLQAVNNRDYPLLQGIFLIITFAVLAANLAADFVYVMLDPRTRQEA